MGLVVPFSSTYLQRRRAELLHFHPLIDWSVVNHLVYGKNVTLQQIQTNTITILFGTGSRGHFLTSSENGVITRRTSTMWDSLPPPPSPAKNIAFTHTFRVIWNNSDAAVTASLETQVLQSRMISKAKPRVVRPKADPQRQTEDLFLLLTFISQDPLIAMGLQGWCHSKFRWKFGTFEFCLGFGWRTPSSFQEKTTSSRTFYHTGKVCEWDTLYIGREIMKSMQTIINEG